MTTDYIPGAVYVTRGNPAWWGAYATVAGQLITRGPRFSLAAHAFLAVDTDTILDLGPGNPGRRPEVAVSSHPQDNGHWWRAWVPDADTRAHIVATAWAEMRRPIEDQPVHSTAACIRAGRWRFPPDGQRCCSVFIADIVGEAHRAQHGNYALTFGVAWTNVLPSDIARVANVGTGITH